ncbi:hypothetical protein MMC27_002904 [Xylographa pallens]|nr:hypothetical protein [Xylographa pallens]
MGSRSNNLTTEKLKKNDIHYFPKVGLAFDFSEQAALVADGLLNFEHTLSHASFLQLDPEIQTKVREHYPGSRIPRLRRLEEMSRTQKSRHQERYQIQYQDTRFELAQEICKNAKNIVAAKEPRWSHLIKHQLFCKLIELARSAEGISPHGQLKSQETVEKLRVEDEDTWLYAQKILMSTTPKEAPRLTAPKPDLYIALPIMEESDKGGFKDDNYIKNFVKCSLANLEEEGLAPCPMISLNRRDVGEKHLVCFPCAIVEIKHQKVTPLEIEKCYCQAANAAAASLVMLNKLARYSIAPGEHETIRPVVSFTFIGYRARVWIAYISAKSHKDLLGKEQCTYVMQCIWEGDIRRNLDTVQLCCIIENLQFWILKHFRPWVSSCLDRWYYPGLEAIRYYDEEQLGEPRKKADRYGEESVEESEEESGEKEEEEESSGNEITVRSSDEETTDDNLPVRSSGNDSDSPIPSIVLGKKGKVNGRKVSGGSSDSAHDSTRRITTGAKRSQTPSGRGTTALAPSPGRSGGNSRQWDPTSLNLSILGSQVRIRARSAEPRS